MVQFNSKHWKTKQTFKTFYSELAGRLQEKLPKAPNKFTSQTTKNYYAKISCNVSDDLELSNVSEEVIKKILLSFDTSKGVGMDQIQQNVWGTMLKYWLFLWDKIGSSFDNKGVKLTRVV